MLSLKTEQKENEHTVPMKVALVSFLQIMSVEYGAGMMPHIGDAMIVLDTRTQ